MKSCAGRPVCAACSLICGMFRVTHGSPIANTKSSPAGASATGARRSPPLRRVSLERGARGARRRSPVAGAIDVKPLYIFNTLGRRVEEFEPLNPPVVTYYSCGPTVYLPQHLGNMRAYVFVDTLRRALEFNGYRVRHVMNVTDVGHMTSDEDAGEDKIEKTARAQGKSPLEVANFYLEQFQRDCAALNLEPPNIWSRATDHIGDMIALTTRIIDAGVAYVTRSGVY